ncbi:MAG: hypothetical protein KGK08_13290 [Acidobacteriota bacterium]|nr:hypothetical protein [Acidobacteriota bacterium]
MSNAPTRSVDTSFPCAWSAEVLTAPPLIAPARQYTYPRQIAGEEDALARGALRVLVRPAAGGGFLATCALGFTNPGMPSGIYTCPNPAELCAVAGGYAYLVQTTEPERCTHLGMRPVVQVLPLPGLSMLLFVGFHTVLAWGREGQLWETARLSWEGLRLGEIVAGTLHGHGWDLMTDREVPFTVDLATGQHQGGSAPAARR